MNLRGALATAVLAPALLAQPAQTPPRIVHKVEPQYSEEARKARLEGSVVVLALVSADGTPRDLKVLRRLGLGLDEEAIKAVSQWRLRRAPIRPATPLMSERTSRWISACWMIRASVGTWHKLVSVRRWGLSSRVPSLPRSQAI